MFIHFSYNCVSRNTHIYMKNDIVVMKEEQKERRGKAGWDKEEENGKERDRSKGQKEREKETKR